MLRNFFKKKGDTDLNNGPDDNQQQEAEIIDVAEQAGETEEPRATASETQPPSAEADLRNKLVRLQADFDNFRKRTQAGRQEARDEAKRELMLDMLPIYDNFERALTHAQEQEDYGALLTGIQGIMQQMKDFFSRSGLKEISAEPGTAFNPSLHDALGTVPGDIENHETVAQEILKGFQMNGYVIRPAQVLVFANP